MFKFYASTLLFLLITQVHAVVVVNELETAVYLHGFRVYLEGDCVGGADYKIYNNAHQQILADDGEYELNAGGSVEIIGAEMFSLTVPGFVCGRRIYPVSSNSLIKVMLDGKKIKVIHESKACECEKK